MGQMAVVPLLAVGAVAACLALLAAPAVALQAAVTENHPRIYVASLPSILNTRTLTDYDVRRFFTQFGADPNGVWSNPVGNYVSERDDMELRNTYMYGLDVLFHRQLLQSPLRVHSAEEADVVFLPIYADLGCRLSQEKEEDFAAWIAATDAFWGTFNQNFPDADRKPHFVVTGRREAENMAHCGVDGTMYGKVEACNFLCHPYAKNLLMLTVEVFTGSLEKMAPQPLRPNSVVVPWPGHWHLHLGSPYFSRPFDPVAHRDARQYLAMESLKVRLPLRELLYKSCMERSQKCLHYAPRGRISQFNQSEIYGNIKSAWYCIQPPGDGPSRHATMDCLAADTMPVFFDQHLTAVMPFSDIIDFAEFTEYIDPDELQATNANAIDVLQAAFTEEKALERASRLHEVKHVFLYALNPDHALIRWDEAYGVHPLDDAFTASMKALLRRSCDLGLEGRCDKAAAMKAAARGTARSAAPFGLLKKDGAPGSSGSGSDSSLGDSDQASTGSGAGSGSVSGGAHSSGGGGGEDSGDQWDEDSSDSSETGESRARSSRGSASTGGSKRASEAKPQAQWGHDEATQEETQDAVPKDSSSLSRASSTGASGNSNKSGHTTGSGDGSPAVKRGDSSRYPGRDEREVVEEEAEGSDAASAEADEESEKEETHLSEHPRKRPGDSTAHRRALLK
mmetsp:Transcript_3023/g.8820  ORF Transcript_3023/g.8820 Transcript_3023/m.8820 type:complete len:679 (+) Transcript_3023:373-2409(+)